MSCERADVFVIAGQSNASGFGTNNQTYTGTSKSQLFANDYLFKAIADPVDVNTNQVDVVSSDASAAASPWPLLANSITTLTGRPIILVPCAKASNGFAAWQPGNDHVDRTTLYGSMVYRARIAAQVGTLRCVLYHGGEQEALVSTSQSACRTYIDTLAAAVLADLGVKLMPCKLQQCGDRNVTAVNAAIAQAWAQNSNVLTGPDFSDITPSVDGLHFKTDAELSTARDRWFSAIQAAGVL